jgi:purine-binding chemotaxis protein CheW
MSDSDPERARAVLEARARRLARPPAAPRATDVLEVVEFGLGRERYALAAADVGEVFRLTGRSALPGAPEPIAGVTAHRGELLVLVDLRAQLGLRAGALDDLARVLVLQRDHTRIGLLLDRVEGIRSVRRSELAAAPGVANGQPGLRIGVTPDLLAVLDADAILRSFDGDQS